MFSKMMVQECIVFFAATLFWSQIFVTTSSSEHDSGSCSTHDSEYCSTQSMDYENSYENTYDNSVSVCDTHATNECSSTVYDYTVKNCYGEDVSLRKYQGQTLVIVNYASTCAFTETNVNELSTLANNYRDKNVKVLVFPSNSFCENVGGNPAAIKFQEDHPEFEVFSEVCVNGQDEEPLYTYLKTTQPGTLGCSEIQWNFVKFVVDTNGHPVDRYGSVDCTCEGLETSVQRCCC